MFRVLKTFRVFQQDSELLAYDAGSPYLEQVMQLFCRTWNRDMGSTRRYFVDFAMQQPDFLGRLIVQREQVLAFAFGTRSLPGQWWHDRVTAQLGKSYPVFQDAWVVTELAVAASHRKQGLAKRLMAELMSGQPASNILLSTQQYNTAARQLYEGLGFVYLSENFVFRSGESPFVIMHRESPQHLPEQLSPQL